MIERVSRYCLLIDLPEDYRAEAVTSAFVEAFETVPANLRRSLTIDQGSEWAQWHCLAATCGLDVWFGDPHSSITAGSPWSRPSRSPQTSCAPAHNASVRSRALYHGATWPQIAERLGVFAQAAHRRYRWMRYDLSSGQAWQEPPLKLQ